MNDNTTENKSDILTRKLSFEEQQEILSTLFGFHFEPSGDINILLDDDGDEFYANTDNCRFDFSTLAGVFSYTAHIAYQRGQKDKQSEIKKAIGLT